MGESCIWVRGLMGERECVGVCDGLLLGGSGWYGQGCCVFACIHEHLTHMFHTTHPPSIPTPICAIPPPPPPLPTRYAWDRNLTDSDGPYVELMAGVYTDNQPDFSFLHPYETRTFTQYW